jgi:hypothetical protein
MKWRISLCTADVLSKCRSIDSNDMLYKHRVHKNHPIDSKFGIGENCLILFHGLVNIFFHVEDLNTLKAVPVGCF